MRSKKTVAGFLVLLLMLLTVLLPVSALAKPSIPEPPEAVYVADYTSAGVLTQETKDYIVEKAGALDDACGAQIVVVAVDFIGDSNIEEYAKAMFNEWGIGDSKKNNGVLLLMVLGADDYWCMQGSGLESSLSSGTIKTILNNDLEPYFAAKQYSQGAQAFFDSVYARLCGIYNVTPAGAQGGSVPGNSNVPASARSASTEKSGGFGFMGIFGLIILIIIISAISSGRRRPRGYVPPRRTTYYVPPRVRPMGSGYHPPVHRAPMSRPVSRPSSFGGHSSFSGGRSSFSSGRSSFGGGHSFGGGGSRGGGAGRH